MFSYGSARRRSQAALGLAETPARLFAAPVHIRVSLALALMLPCGGCLVGPDFSAPSAPTADKWRESNDPAYLASIASYDYVLANLLGQVATTYIGIRTLQTQIDIARENIVRQKKALAIALAKYRGGTATKLDVYQAENVLAQTEAA